MDTPTVASRCQAVLFDVDDTLYEVGHLVQQSWVAHAPDLARLGLDAHALAAAYGRHRHRRTIPAAVALALDELAAPRSLADRVHQISEAYLPTTLPAQTGVLDLLTKLRHIGVGTAVVTNGNPARQHAKLDALGMRALFDTVVVCDGHDVPHKPDPAGFRTALRILGVDPSAALMVGDRVDYDIVPALALGMRGLRVRVGNHAAVEPGAGVVEHDQPARVWAAVLEAVTTGR